MPITSNAHRAFFRCRPSRPENVTQRSPKIHGLHTILSAHLLATGRTQWLAITRSFKAKKNQEWYFNLKAGNHEIILQSEGYKQRTSAENGIASVQKNSADDARYERKESDKGNYWFLLKATNGQTIGKSEMYTTGAARDKGIESVKKNGPSETIKEKDA